MSEYPSGLVWSQAGTSKFFSRYGGNSLPSEMIALEPRVMLDGAAAIAVIAETDPSEADNGQTETPRSETEAPATSSEPENSSEATGNNNSEAAVVIIDAAIDNPADLLVGMDPSADVFYLDDGTDGIQQITNILSRYSNISSLHILSHGTTGAVTLGTSNVDALNVETYAGDFVQWDAALADGADILFYGCNIGQDGAGRQFIDLVAELTNADVAASDDLTGHEALGGDWDLEAATGTIEAGGIVSLAAQSAFTDVLMSATETFESLAFGTAVDALTLNGFVYTSSTTGVFSINEEGDRDVRIFNLTGSTQTLTITRDGGGDFIFNSINFDVFVGGFDEPQTIELFDSSNNSLGQLTTLAFDSARSDPINTLDFIAVQNVNRAVISSPNNTFAFFDDVETGDPGNEAPTATGIPSTVTVIEDQAGNFDLSSIVFADLENDNLTVTLAASAGTFAATGSGGVTVGGTGSSTLMLSGAAANINTYLDTVTNIQFTGAANASGNAAATVTVNADDGTSNPSLGTINVNITPVNDAPTATGIPSTVTVLEDVASNVDLSGITFTDVDGDNLTVTLTASSGTFASSDSGGVFVRGTGTGTLTLIGSAASINGFLDTVTNIRYTGPANVNGNSAASVTVNVNDGTVNPQLGTFNVNITPVNDAPIIANLTGDVATAVAGGAPVNIDVGGNALVTDPDGASRFSNGFILFDITAGTDNGSFSVDGVTVTSGGDAVIADNEIISVSGVNIGTVGFIGTTNDGQNGNPLRIDFLGAGPTPAELSTLIQSLLYAAPSGLGDRTLTTTLNDGDGVANGGDADTVVVSTIAVSTPPQVASIERQVPGSTPTNADAVTFRVTFDVDVTNVDISDFALSGTLAAGSVVTGTTRITDSIYDVAVDVPDGGNGTINLDISATPTVLNASGINLPGSVAPLGADETYTLDNSAPAAPSIPDLAAGSDTGFSSSDNNTSDNTPTFTGTAEANAIVTISSSVTGMLGSATANGAGNWSFTPAAPLADGAHTINATATDTVGNTGPASGGLAIVIDTLAPAAPSLPDLDPVSDLGRSNTDDVTADTTPTLNGTAEANSTVTVSSSIAGVLGTTIADGAGNWSFTPAVPLGNGVHSFTVTATDAAGNTGPVSIGLLVAIDAIPPAAPSAPDLDPASDTGLSNTDNITADHIVIFTGTAEANATVTVTSSIAGVLGTAIADGAGNWSFTPAVALADGVHTVTATATDIAGNTGPASAGLAVTIDTSAPAAPSTPDLIALSDTGVSDTDNNTSDNTPTFTGTAEANAIVTISSSVTGILGSATANGAGNWSFTPAAPLADGAHTITATATDTAGNTSPVSGGLAIVIDTLAPAAPSLPDLDPVSDLGRSNTDDVTADTTPTLNGTAEANSTVTVSSSIAGVLGTTIADGAGNWSFTPAVPLGNGVHSFTVTATDAAGNTGPVSIGLLVAIDAIPPAAPSAPNLDPASDTGLSNTDNITADHIVIFTGTAEANATVTVTSSIAGVLGTAIADGAGNWSFTPAVALADGVHTVTATATDIAGNTGPASAGLAVTIDTSAPAAPSTPDLIALSDTGVSDTDNNTSDTTPTFTGTAEANAIVTISSSVTGILGSTTANGSGNWSFTPSVPLADGAHTITATATDTAGNTGPVSGGLAIVIDTIVPAAPSTPDLVAASDTGVSSTDNVTADATATFAGTAEARATVTLTSSVDGVVGSGTADGSGQWTITTNVLTEATHNISAAATDTAGNTSPASAALSVTVDQTGPVLSALDGGSTFTEGLAPVRIDTDANIADAGFDAINDYAGAVLTISRDGGAAPSDLFGFISTAGVALVGNELQFGGNTFGVFNQAAGALTVNFTSAATPATSTLVDAVLRGLSYSNLLDAPPASVTLNYNITDAVGLSATGTTQALVNITPVNDAPVNTVPVAQTVTEDTPLVFSAANGNQFTIADPDAGNNVLTSILTVNSGTLSAATGGGAAVTGNNTGTVTLTGTIAQINAALSTLVYNLNADFFGADTLTLTTNDNGNTGTGGALTDTATVAIAVTPVNDAPANSVPGPQATENDTDLVFSTANGNLISISDIDAGAGTVTTTLIVPAGSLTPAAGSGATVTGGGTSTLTIAGTVAQVNAALSVVTFTPDRFTINTIFLTVTTNDNGNTGGGNLSATDQISIAVSAGQESTGTDGRNSSSQNGQNDGNQDSNFDDTPGNPIGFPNNNTQQDPLLIFGDGRPVDPITTAGIGNQNQTGNGNGVTESGLPGNITLDPSSDTGFSNSDNTTADATPLLTGEAPANSTVTIISSLGGVLGTAIADENGRWSFTAPTLGDGVHELIATPKDEDGNEGVPSLPLLATIDTVAPDAPPAPTYNGDAGQLKSNDTPTFSGAAEPGARIVLTSDPDGVVGEVIADENGNWQLTTGPLSENTHTLSVTATDTAGNSSSASPALELVVGAEDDTALNFDSGPTNLADFTAPDGSVGIEPIDITALLSGFAGNVDTTQGERPDSSETTRSLGFTRQVQKAGNSAGEYVL